jgi:hypothetical protein
MVCSIMTGSVDLYKRNTKDLLLYTQNPSFFGFKFEINYNVGSIENKGIEIAAELFQLVAILNGELVEMLPSKFKNH